jgi:hypothetical protein
MDQRSARDVPAGVLFFEEYAKGGRFRGELLSEGVVAAAPGSS